ncbi:urease accessory protein UreD [Planctomicrobium sp. SH527]|uniref:urease accessory protein UreD n=1 Tax=Planctomicrobium sp. SH527 TaxID=3448123 RepID=UPI003F5C3D29
MGARATLITHKDLVIPPEFRELRLPKHGAGRIGGARVELVRLREETHMGGCYQQIPLRIMPPFAFDSEQASLLYFINLTAGLMDGDGHLIEITAREGTQTVATGQSATRVHPALTSFATQQFKVEVENDACLVVLPGPLIPFQGCRYFQRGRAELAPRARMLWGDIWLAGRYDRGKLSERFQFKRIVQDFEVRRAGQLIYRDRFDWQGPWGKEQVDWYFGGELASGSLFVAGPLPEELPPPPAGVRRAVFRLDNGESCVRWCGHPTQVTADLVITTLTLAAQWSDKPGTPPWLLASSDLAPNHWFSTPVDHLRAKSES